MPPVSAARSAHSPIREALHSGYGVFGSIGLFSCVVNLLMLTGPFFMLQVYDRVLSSRSVPTLVVLLGLAAMLYAFQGALDFVRSRILARFGERFDRRLRKLIFDVVAFQSLNGRREGDGQQPIRDFDQIRQFLGSQGPVAVFDLPWMPIYLAVLFLLHVWLGLVALGGAILLCIFTLLTEVKTRNPTRAASQKSSARNAVAETCRRNVEALAAMGMLPALRERWVAAHGAFLGEQQRAVDAAGGIGAAAKVFRFFLQSLMLAVGAYLVILQEVSPGVMIASSILSSRALAPIELAIANWRGFVGARQSYRRLIEVAEESRDASPEVVLPRPSQRLDVDNLAVVPPGTNRPTLSGVSFSVGAGDAVGVIGASGSGKSTLARGLVGVWTSNRGGVRLDGATLDQWDRHDFGRYVGYLPQDIELFPGTVAENIARFRPDATSQEILAATRRAGVHEMIVRLPAGYETRIGDGGQALSAGQRQRVALARALYGDPFLIVLDEPNSNLDAEGEAALTHAIRGAREAGSVVIVIAHRPSALAAVDKVLVLAEGRQQAFGPKDEVLGRVLKHPTAVAS
ncbi:type I secretion system permease/ATPase [Rhodoligotrophos ferricapiens]|uniref:type I secretion system permease/ATPase n=1 Tax=Rhodoligotrophos ferricapiens TaxID=3069264 RepID=UPI00315CE8BE